MRVLFDQVIETDYGQFDLRWAEDCYGFDGSWEKFYHGQTNGLVGAANPDGVHINIARRFGGSHVQIVLLTTEPLLEDQWEDIVEVSVIIPDGATVMWSTWASETQGKLDIPGGNYRLRVCATGRDDADEFADEVKDFYLLQLWPAEPHKDDIVRQTTHSAEYWNEQIPLLAGN